jgi:5-methylcytosine-specific restriction endonuclease McrA
MGFPSSPEQIKREVEWWNSLTLEHRDRLRAAATGAVRRKPLRKKTTREMFYRSTEWKQARELCFKVHGRKCYKCSKAANQIDHVFPRSKFPELALEQSNLRPICWPCNRRKATFIETLF